MGKKVDPLGSVQTDVIKESQVFVKTIIHCAFNPKLYKMRVTSGSKGLSIGICSNESVQLRRAPGGKL